MTTTTGSAFADCDARSRRLVRAESCRLQLRVQLPHPVGGLAPRERAASVAGEHREPIRSSRGRQRPVQCVGKTVARGRRHPRPRRLRRRRRSPRSARRIRRRSPARRASEHPRPARGRRRAATARRTRRRRPKTAARSAASSAPRTCRLRSGMPAAAARSAIAGSSPSGASITTTGRSTPDAPTAASPASSPSDRTGAPAEQQEALRQIEHAAASDLVRRHGEAERSRPGDHPDAVAERSDLTPAVRRCEWRRARRRRRRASPRA